MSPESLVNGSEDPVSRGLPHSDPCLSFWLQNVRSNPLLDYRSTEDLPQKVDVVIIGSGICGALTAQGLLSTAQKPSVLCLEARDTCSGATGRNAGHCRPDTWRGFGRYSKAFGKEAALEILEDERVAFERLTEYIINNEVDCDFWSGQAFDVPISDSVAQDLAEIWSQFTAAGGKTENIQVITDPEEAARISKVAGAKSLFIYRGSTLYPWKLVEHILRDALSKGLNLQTRTAAEQVRPAENGTWDVVTPRGVVNCQQVVHATNAYAVSLLPEFEGLVRPTPHFVHRIVPPDCLASSRALNASYHVICEGHAIHSINTRKSSDGSLCLGGSNPGYPDFREWVAKSPKNTLDDSLASWPSVKEEVLEMTSKQLWPGVDMTPRKKEQIYIGSWSGVLARSVDGMPFIGPIPGKPGQFACIGHNGHGMARMFTCAEGLVKMMHGATFESTGLPSPYHLTAERLANLRNKKDIMPIH